MYGEDEPTVSTVRLTVAPDALGRAFVGALDT